MYSTERADFMYCKEIVNRHYTSFPYTFSQLPEEKANAVYAIYAFCLIIDDLVEDNNSTSERVAALKKLENKLDLFAQGKEINHPLSRALRTVFDRFDMDIELFYDQIRGQEMGINFAVHNTMFELEQYSYYVAGSVGLMVLPIVASEHHGELKQVAVDLGLAVTFTRVLRDLGKDFFEKGRIYLPVSELKSFAYTRNDLEAGIINESYINMCEKLASRADHLYARFANQVQMFDHDCQRPVILCALVYQGILDTVREKEYDCLSKGDYTNKE